MKVIQGNRINLLKNGAGLFPALVREIDAATDDIRIETYIFEDDATGRRIADALARAAARGVAVRVLVDGFGSLKTSEAFFSALQHAGVKVLFYRPVRGKWIPTRHRMRRMHRKIALIDGRVGFVGGLNLIDDFTENLSDTHPRLDYAVQVEGPILVQMYGSVFHLWHTTKWFSPQRLEPNGAIPMIAAAPIGNVALSFVVRDNIRHRRNIEREYRTAIGKATNSVLIVSPYFLPGGRLRRTLIDAAARGVAVQVLLQGIADHPLMQMATRALYGQLLDAGVVIYEYNSAMLHGKVAVVDGRWATVGSSNLDPFSLVLNREANIVVHDAAFAAVLQASVRHEISTHGDRLDVSAWRRRSLMQKVRSWLALGLVRVASVIFGAVGE
jgi:cardiolipin synthase